MSNHDVYHQWLGIPPDQQPPTLYQLLGVARFEKNAEVIRNAAERQALHVRRLARGEFTDVGQELLNEIAEAKLCLMNATRRDAYDKTLGKPAEQFDTQTDAGRATFEEVGSSSINATYINIALAQPGQPVQDRWIIGFHPDCDFRVESGTVSGVHCQITYSKRGLQITDLNSTNGTYINQKRIRGVRPVYKQDLVTLGRDNRILLPGNLMASDGKSRAAVFVGKGPGNEIQVDRPTVSLFHARVVIDDGHATLEDLQSRNGTFVVRDGGQPCRIQRCRLQPTDVVYLGDARIQASKLMAFGGVT